jgi:hypothetical protein
MKTENETSGSRTGTTSPNEPANTSNGKKPAPKPGDPAPTNDEAAFLAQQAADAKAAISAALSDIGTNLGQAVNVGALTRQHPWLTLGASTVAGFIASALLVPSKEDQALKKLAKIERALNPAPPVSGKPEESSNGDSAQDYKKGKQSFGRAIFGEVIKAVQPAILSMLTAGVTAKATKPSQEEMEAAAASEDQKQAGVPPTE